MALTSADIEAMPLLKDCAIFHDNVNERWFKRPGLYVVKEQDTPVLRRPCWDAPELGRLDKGKVVNVTEIVRPAGTKIFRGKIEWTDEQGGP